MNFEKIKGYKNLTEEQKNIFQKVFYKHQRSLGPEAKKDFTPVSVQWEKTYLKVFLKNKTWLHYTCSGFWY